MDEKKVWPLFDGTFTVEPSLLLGDPTETELLESDWATVRGEDEPEDGETTSVPSLSKEELRKFVMDFVDGRIFSSAHVRDPDLIPVVFMPLMFGALKGLDLTTLGIVYEHADTKQQAGRSVNGNPMFYSCRLMNTEDWHRASNAIEREINRRKEVDLGL